VFVASYAERPDLAERTGEIGDVWPEFIHHARLNRHWHRLREDFLDFQFVVYDEEADVLVGRGHSIPFPRDGGWDELPDGVEGVFDRVFEEGGGEPTTLSAVAAVVDPRHQGRGLSRLVIEGMRTAAARAGLDALVAPVRPTLKERYPLAPMERYIEWRRDDGQLYDPWLRVHERLGAEIIGVCPGALIVEGTVAEWEEWTGMGLPDSGAYVVEGALVPVEIDRDTDSGRYVEPNVWMRHSL
jgi:GNAT superfamily N-acetyltransferase